MRFPQFIAVTWLALMGALAPAHAGKRVALVIGNDRYANLPAHEQLQKAVNDARAVGGALRQIGFEVISGENLGRQALLARLDETAQRLTTGDTVFFFFSGHGVAVDGANYILPADVPNVGSGQIASLTGAAIKEGDISTRLLRAGAQVAVVVLDSCRNNPFASSGTKGIGGEKGLAPHEPPNGVFTLYAASRGEAALDRLYDGDRNPNSVFTRVLVPALARTDLDLPMLAREVREEVTRLARSVNHDQRPAYYDETNGDRIFLAGRDVKPASGVVEPASGVVEAPQSCTTQLPASPQHHTARVTRFVSEQEVLSITRTVEGREQARISPAYRPLRRVYTQISQSGGSTASETMAAIPEYMTVKVGDVVELNSRYRDPTLPCSFIPWTINRIIARGGPARR